MRILGIPGSLRQGSHNRRLLQASGRLLEERLPEEPGGGRLLKDPVEGRRLEEPVELVIFDGLKAVEPFDEDDEDTPGDGVRAWRTAIAAADALLFATPEYSSSLPGQLKNALDWAARPFATSVLRNKPVAVIGASTSMFGAVWAQAELRKVLAAAGARVIDRQLPVAGAAEAFDAAGDLSDGELRAQLAELLDELVAQVGERVAQTRERVAVYP